jgi:cytochrome P450
VSEASEATRAHNRTFITMDEPEHNEQRLRFTAAFTVRRVEGLRPRVAALVDGLLDAMEAAGPPADLVPAFALRPSRRWSSASCSASPTPTTTSSSAAAGC